MEMILFSLISEEFVQYPGGQNYKFSDPIYRSTDKGSGARVLQMYMRTP